MVGNHHNSDSLVLHRLLNEVRDMGHALSVKVRIGQGVTTTLTIQAGSFATNAAAVQTGLLF